ncbi:MAG: response regulator [Lachnospiraceae bacterium]|nr:response regulator [Lachnospiraceae bacterium]
MEEKPDKKKVKKRIPLLFPIILMFCMLGAVVFLVSRKITMEMSESAIQNLSESLDLLQSTIESIIKKEAEFQELMARDIAASADPEEYIRSYQKNETMVKISLIRFGETEGISSTGEKFSEEGLDFSSEGTIGGLPVSRSYVNYMGTWAYSLKCPVVKDGVEMATLYVEYVYDSLDQSLPNGFYDGRATLYIMDAESERFVLKPKGMGMRSAGHLNLTDFYRANSIEEDGLREEVSRCIKSGDDILFYHDIRDIKALTYMWAVNDGTLYLIGYVPLEAIQQEGKTVNQNILIVVFAMLTAFFLCCLLYYFNRRQQDRVRREREAEREIHNLQLAEALQAARIASNSKTMFLSNMSHDIRTPMNAVLGFTTLLSMDAENPAKVREYTKKIMASGQHLLNLINDILDVSKIESGKVVLGFEEFTLNDLVSSVNAIIRPMAAAKCQDFYVDVTGVRHERLVGDEMRMNQILINLLSNAVKYTQEGGRIWFRIIGLKQRSGQYEHIRIEVEDNGYGMSQEYLKTIFDAFTRAENSTTNKVQGTGLGMAITKNIVELMGGTIEVFSQVDKGSLFRIELELRIAQDQADRQFWTANKIDRLLLADRDEEDVQNIRTLMRETGVWVDTVSDMETCISRIRESGTAGEGYQLLLVEWEMAEKEDFRQMRELRDAWPDLPVLFLMSCDAQEAAEILPIENAAVLNNPFFVAALKEKIVEMQGEQGYPAAEEAEEYHSLTGMRFLAAEDNAINAEILTELLEIEEAACEIAENGRLAVERFTHAAEGEFDAILMDVQMPVMNGYDAARAIRSLSRPDAAEIPIIAMTANAFAEDEKAALDAGMNAHVAKPIDMKRLRKAIGQCMEREE